VRYSGIQQIQLDIVGYSGIQARYSGISSGYPDTAKNLGGCFYFFFFFFFFLLT
jgi:hypothetical protein